MGFLDDFRKGVGMAQKVADAAGVTGPSTGNRAYDQAYAISQILREDSHKPSSKRRSVDIGLTQFPEGYDGLEPVSVVGESHYQAGLSAITGRRGDEGITFDCLALLVPDWDNQPDRPETNATAIHIKAPDNPLIEHVGYLSTEDGKRYRPAVEAILRHGNLIACPAVVIAVDPAVAETPNAGVTLRLPPPDFIVGLT